MKKKEIKKNLITIFTSSGNLTLAHYFLMKKILKYTKDYNLFFGIGDLHALSTSDLNHFDQLKKQKNLALHFASYLYAFGFPDDVIYRQSNVLEHVVFAYLLGCFVSPSRLNHMIQYKTKKKEKNFDSVALLSYPLLMASDILLIDADVFVGNDQKQHLEFARDVADYLNHNIQKEIFHKPKIINQDDDFFKYRIYNLKKPFKKMSKSETSGVIFIDDDPEKIKKIFIKAVTDSENKIKFDFEKKPGVSNLILIYSLIKDLQIKEAEAILQKKCKDYYEFKLEVANSVIKEIIPIQNKAKILFKNHQILKSNLEKGRLRIKKIIDQKLKKISDLFDLDLKI